MSGFLSPLFILGMSTYVEKVRETFYLEVTLAQSYDISVILHQTFESEMYVTQSVSHEAEL